MVAWYDEAGASNRKVLTMKYPVISAAVIATTIFAFNPASADMMMCSNPDMSRMSTTIAAMPDGPKKWAMNKHLAMVNAAMAKDGVHGCNMAMMEMMHGSKMSMMKSGM